MFSALLGFSAVVLLTQPAFQSLAQGKPPYVPLFVIVLVSQILLEIIAKYQGKLCETIEGLFTALIAVLGFALAVALYSKGFLGAGGMQNSGPFGNGSLPPTTFIFGAAIIVGAFLFIWKKWIKPILPITIAGCGVQQLSDQALYGPAQPQVPQMQQPQMQQPPMQQPQMQQPPMQQMQQMHPEHQQ